MKQSFFQIRKLYRQIFSYPVLKIVDGNTDYDAYWKDKRGKSIGRLSHWQKQRADILLKHIEKSKLVSIVDVGCGDGSMLSYIQKNTGISRAVGIDISNFALDKAKEYGIETVQADITKIESSEVIPQTDYVILFEILEHIQDSEKFLASMFQKVSKGVFFSFPNTGFYAHRLRLLFGKFPLQWRLHPREHVRFWTLTDVRWWLGSLEYKEYVIHTYEGVPLLKDIWPSLFAAGIFVCLPKK